MPSQRVRPFRQNLSAISVHAETNTIGRLLKSGLARNALAVANPFLVSKNEKGTLGAYYSLTKNLTLLLEGTRAKSTSQAGGANSATTVNIGAYVGF